MKRICILLGTLFSLFSAKAQKDTTHYIYDTAKVFIWFVNDPAFGSTSTCYALKITKSKMDFLQPSADELKKDSLTLHRQKNPVGFAYYVPAVFLDSVATKKQRKKIYQSVYVPLPPELVLFDANKNFEYLAPKNTTKSVDSTKKANDSKEDSNAEDHKVQTKGK